MEYNKKRGNVNSEQIKVFLEDLQKQGELYQEIQELNFLQLEVLDADGETDSDRLFSFIGKKQSLMTELTLLENKLKPLKELWQRGREALPEKIQNFAQELLDQIAQIIKDLLTMEEQLHKRLEGLLSSAQQGLGKIRQQSKLNQAYSAYGAQKKTEPRYVDHQSKD